MKLNQKTQGMCVVSDQRTRNGLPQVETDVEQGTLNH